MKHLHLFESFSTEPATLDVLRQRLAAEFADYVASEDLDISTPDDEAYEFDEFLSREKNLGVDESTGIIDLRYYTPDLYELLQDLPVGLYHYTSSTLVPSIQREGLRLGTEQSNPYENSFAGVYLTTEYSGRAIDGYVYNAVQRHGGEGIRVFVRAYLRDLQPDPDDADIASGDCQFVADAVSVDDILGIKRLHERL